ncbi:MAG: thioesterase family protein [Clostridium sp.]|nr:thioesterase family protein [Clostridium sp.]
MFINDTKIKVRYAETDKMGIVHHSRYYIYFELARDEYIEKLGFTYKHMEDMGVMLPIVETHAKYIEGAKYGDIILVKTHIKEITGVKVVFEYEIYRTSDDKLLLKGGTTQAFVDSKKFKIINVKKEYPELWEKISKN